MAHYQYYALVFLTSLLVIVGGPRPQPGGLVYDHAPTCKPFASSIPMCSGLGYPNATFPNHRNQEKMSEANAEIRHFLPLIETNCSNALLLLLCAVYAPFCDASYPQAFPIPPCVPLCEYVRRGCEDILLDLYNISWPAQLHCERYTLPTQSNRASLCFGPRNIEELITITPPPTSGNGTVDPPVPDFNITTDVCRLDRLTFAWCAPDYISEGSLVDYQYSCELQPPNFPKLFTNVSVPSNGIITDKLDGFDLSTVYTCSVSVNSSNDTSGYAAMTTLKTLDEPVLIHFVNGTPTVRRDTIYAEFIADQAVDHVSCTLLPRGRAPTLNCTSGKVIYSDLEPGQYFLRLIARNGTCAMDKLRRKVEVPCRITKSSYRIGKSNVIVKFAGVGISGAPLTDFTCSVNGQTAQSCTSPHRVRFADLAADTGHRLDILPNDEACLEISKEPHTVDITIRSNQP